MIPWSPRSPGSWTYYENTGHRSSWVTSQAARKWSDSPLPLSYPLWTRCWQSASCREFGSWQGLACLAYRSLRINVKEKCLIRMLRRFLWFCCIMGFVWRIAHPELADTSNSSRRQEAGLSVLKWRRKVHWGSCVLPSWVWTAICSEIWTCRFGWLATLLLRNLCVNWLPLSQ